MLHLPAAPPSPPVLPARRAPTPVSVLRTRDPRNWVDRDLCFLDKAVNTARLVQLGESSHCTSEFSTVKLRLIRYLHERLGFDVLAFENPMLATGSLPESLPSLDPQRWVSEHFYGVWQTEEVAELIDYVRATHTTPRPLVLVGIDPQVGPWERRHRAAFWRDLIAPLDPHQAEAAVALESAYLTALEGIPPRTPPWPHYQAIHAAHGARFVQGYRDVAAYLASHAEALQGLHPSRPGLVRLATLMAESSATEISTYGGPFEVFSATRDRLMAHNLEVLLEGRKGMLWAHNAHVQHRGGLRPGGEREKPLGQWLKERLGADLFTIGLFMGHGRTGNDDRSDRPISPLKVRSIEGILDAYRGPYVFADFRALPGGTWPDQHLSGKYWGGQDYPMVPREHFDALLYVDEVHPPRWLPKAEVTP